MSERQLNEARPAVKLEEQYCSRCAVCYSLCPFDAAKKDATTGKIVIDIEKCQVCGLCYSACPANAIDVVYYDHDSLVSYLKAAREKHASDSLVVACKGSAPEPSQLGRLFGVSDFITLSVPCVGRIPVETFLAAIAMGLRDVYVLACDEDYCRFERGSPVTGRRIMALNRLLEQLGYGKGAITLRRGSLKVTADRERCVSCGNCVFYCPYGAAKLESPGTASFDLKSCRGCGLCAVMCPAFALELENWEGERISALIPHLLSAAQEPKILAFRCQWAAFPSPDGQVAPNVSIIDLPCAARVDPVHVLKAFQEGAAGVLVAACSEEDCKQEKASGRAKRSVAKLQESLKQIGLADRLYFCSVAPRYGEFDRELGQFSQRISDMAKGVAR